MHALLYRTIHGMSAYTTVYMPYSKAAATQTLCRIAFSKILKGRRFRIMTTMATGYITLSMGVDMASMALSPLMEMQKLQAVTIHLQASKLRKVSFSAKNFEQLDIRLTHTLKQAMK